MEVHGAAAMAFKAARLRIPERVQRCKGISIIGNYNDMPKKEVLNLFEESPVLPLLRG